MLPPGEILYFRENKEQVAVFLYWPIKSLTGVLDFLSRLEFLYGMICYFLYCVAATVI